MRYSIRPEPTAASAATRLLAATAMLFAASGGALAGKYTLHTWLNPTYIFTAEGNIGFANSVRAASNGEIDFDVLTGGVLFPPNGTVEGISSGVAEAGPIAPTYYPSQFPVSNAIGDMGFANPDAMLLTFAYADFAMHDAAANSEWEGNNLVFSAAGATPSFYLMCNGDVKTLPDIAGKRVRAPGAGWSRITEAFGGIAVNIPGSEIYTAMERGAVDCAIGDTTMLTTGGNIIEMVDSVILQPMNPVYITGMIVYNPDFWKSLTDDNRRLLLDEAAKAMVKTQIGFTAEARAALDAAKAKGIKLYEPDETVTKAYAAFVASGAGGMDEIAKNNYKIADPKPLFDDFTTYMDKWAKLLDGVDRTDEAALTALVKANIYDTLDAKTYGIKPRRSTE